MLFSRTQKDIEALKNHINEKNARLAELPEEKYRKEVAAAKKALRKQLDSEQEQIDQDEEYKRNLQKLAFDDQFLPSEKEREFQKALIPFL